MKKILLTLCAFASCILLSAQTVGDVIDMGLSVKWYSCNYKADKPTDAGSLYAYADVNEGGYYSSSMYPHFNSMTWTYNLPLESIAGTSLDASYVGSDGTCRMPTNEEWEELIDNSIITTTKIDDVDGKLITSKINGNSIFLPYVRLMINYNYVNSIYYYGTPAVSSSMAQVVTLGVSSAAPIVINSFSTPYVGLPIRPVQEVEAAPLTGIDIEADKTTLFAGTRLQLNATPIPSESRITGASWTSSNPEVATVSSKGVVTGISSGSVTITIDVNGISKSIDLKVVKVETPASEEYVDLGLSVKWSSKNLGATSNTQYGDKYPWGYTTPEVITENLQYKFFNKNTFQYKLPMKDICGNENYDAVAVATDGKAMLPSADQYTELIEGCDVMQSAIDGISGVIFTSRVNGKSIFFPVNGSTTNYQTGSTNDALSAAKIFRIDTPDKVQVTQNSLPYMQNYVRGVMPFTDIKLESISLNVDELNLYTLNTAQLSVTPNPVGYQIQNIKWTSSDSDIALVTDKGLVIAKTSGTAVITAIVDGISANCQVNVSELKVTEGIGVNMGTGVLWASCDLGASEPYKVGVAYPFGSVEPNVAVDDYPDDIYGTEYDVIHTTMGGDWYMPTPEDFKALIENTEMEWLNWNGTQGALLTSKLNGNTLFFPVNKLGQVYYNSSQLNPQRYDITQAYHATEQSQEMGGLSASIALPVRGICTDLTVGVKTIDSVNRLDVFSLEGVMIKHDADRSDIDALPAGFYIIGGKKVIRK